MNGKQRPEQNSNGYKNGHALNSLRANNGVNHFPPPHPVDYLWQVTKQTPVADKSSNIQLI